MLHAWLVVEAQSFDSRPSSKEEDGLSNTGRLGQAALNDARIAAITIARK